MRRLEQVITNSQTPATLAAPSKVVIIGRKLVETMKKRIARTLIDELRNNDTNSRLNLYIVDFKEDRLYL
jgi:hypothetical protein